MSEQSEAPAQWNVIIDQNSRDYERHKQIERHKEQLRKIAYKNALDDNLNEKRMLAHDGKSEDRRIFESMISKNRTLDQLEQQKKLANQHKLKEMAEQNRRRMEEASSKNNILQREGMQTLVSLSIGNPEEGDDRRKQNKKQELLQFYSQHLQEKRERQQKEKERDRQLLKAQREVQDRQQQQRLEERRRILSHGQNQDIYRYYNSLNELGMRKDYELNTKLVEQAAQSNRQKQEQRMQKDLFLKQRKLEDVKKSLLEQIQRNQESKMQAEQEKLNRMEVHKLSEGELSNRGQTYSKEDYLAFLMKQQELHKRRKSEQKGMSSNEYQLNLQDLQTAVRGGSVHNASPLYIGYGGEQEQRKDQIYFKPLPQSSSRTNRSTVIPEDSLDEYQRRLNNSVAQRLKPAV